MTDKPAPREFGQRDTGRVVDGSTLWTAERVECPRCYALIMVDRQALHEDWHRGEKVRNMMGFAV